MTNELTPKEIELRPRTLTLSGATVGPVTANRTSGLTTVPVGVLLELPTTAKVSW